MAARSAIAITTFAGITHAHGYHLSDLMRDSLITKQTFKKIASRRELWQRYTMILHMCTIIIPAA